MPSLNLTAEIQAKIAKWAFGLLLLGALCGTVYLQGRSDGKLACQVQVQKQVAKIAEQRADNAVEAGKRFGEYVQNDAQLEVGIADALAQVQAYYANQVPETKTVKVQVPGKKEYIYVPTDSCGDVGLNADELRLYNLGNKRSDLDLSDKEGVPGTVPSGPP